MSLGGQSESKRERALLLTFSTLVALSTKCSALVRSESIPERAFERNKRKTKLFYKRSDCSTLIDYRRPHFVLSRMVLSASNTDDTVNGPSRPEAASLFHRHDSRVVCDNTSALKPLSVERELVEVEGSS